MIADLSMFVYLNILPWPVSIFVVSENLVGVITWASHGETKLKIALRFFFSSFSHKSPSGP